MPLPYGNTNQSVSLDEAKRYTKNFRDAVPGPKVKAGAFEREVVDKILAQPGCAGIRCYYGMKDDGAPTVVLVGVDANGDDMTTGTFAENWWPCPPFCSSASPLNG